MCDRKKHLSKLDLYERYWQCRDFELKTLWQKAVFLGPILVMFFTGYGAFFAKCFIVGNEVRLFESNSSENHMVAIAIAIMGMLFSILWIRMMKGSKAWFEVYERAITAMDTQKDWIFGRELLECGAGFKHHRLPGYKFVNKTDKPLFCDCLFSTKGGCYSPSKINIVIGQISLLFWFFIATIHLVCSFAFLVKNPEIVALMVFAIEFLTILVVLYMTFMSKSEVVEFKYMQGKMSNLFGCRSSSLKERDPGVYPKGKSENRIYILRIVDYDKKIEEVIKYPEVVQKWILRDVEKGCLKIILDKDFERWAEYPCYASINFRTWCNHNGVEPSIVNVEKFFKEEINPVYESFFIEIY